LQTQYFKILVQQLNPPHPCPLPKGEGVSYLPSLLWEKNGRKSSELPKGEGVLWEKNGRKSSELPKGEGVSYLPSPKGRGAGVRGQILKY